MSYTYDLIVIGGGPAGYSAAAQASKKGLRTALVENRKLGGTCLHRGCIPTKTILHSTSLYRSLQDGSAPGVPVPDSPCDMEKIQEHKDKVIGQLADGILTLLKKQKTDLYFGTGTIPAAHQVSVLPLLAGESPEAPPLLLSAKNILICTGSEPAAPPIEGIDLPNVLNSDKLLDKKSVYKRLIIIGGGVIGMEFASVYQQLGSKVTVLEAANRLLGNMDREFSASMKMLMKKKGTDIHTGALVRKIRLCADGSLACIFEEKGEEKQIETDGILVAVGRRPQTRGLFGPDFAPDMERGYICVNENFETSIPGIYAAGDVTGGIQLAHAATAEALAAVAHMMKQPSPYHLSVIPSCVYTCPELASVGLTPEEAKTGKAEVRTVKYPMSANGKSVLSNQERGFIKITADAATGQILGAQMMCARATDMISLFTEAIVNHLTAKQLAAAVFPHPTFSEGLREALELLLD